MDNKLLSINELHLENYRCFEKLTIDFHHQLTVLIAANGKGKTAILDAIAVAFGTFVNSTGIAKGSVFHREDVKQNKVRDTISNEMEAQYPLVLRCTGYIDKQEMEWLREFKTSKSATTVKDTKALMQFGQDIRNAAAHGQVRTFPLISYYGTGRLWGNKKLTKNKQKRSSSRLSGYIDCLDPLSSYKAFAEWYEYVCKAEFEEKMEALERSGELKDSEFTHMRKGIQNAINQVLRQSSGWGNIVFRQKAEAIVAEHDTEGELAVALLSDGIRNMIGLVADIAYRTIKLNPHLQHEAPLQTPGVILIDEVDMHLHPKWQQTVLSDIIQAFPSMQFIVTTHSPQVLTTVKREQIRILDTNRVIIPHTHTLGEESSVLLADIMGVSSWPPLEIVEKRKRYQRMVEDRMYNTPEARELRDELEANYGTNHEFFIQADLLIRRFEAIEKANRK